MRSGEVDAVRPAVAGLYQNTASSVQSLAELPVSWRRLFEVANAGRPRLVLVIS